MEYNKIKENMNNGIIFILSILSILIFFIISYTVCIKGVLKNKIIEEYRSHIISRIMRGSARWSLASKQDKSPLVAILHANYGCAYLWALKDVFNDYEIKSATGIDVIKFQNKITNIQDSVTKNVVKLCPEYASGIQDEILSIIAGHE
jgi:hypothetical protein